MKKYFTQYVRANGEIKFFLCDKDVQVGDTFNSANGTGFICTREDAEKFYSIGGLHSDKEEVPHSKIFSYKVIGEVSEDATWVKEGDNFDGEQEVKRVAKGIGNPVNSKYHIYLIKGPCGHFH